MAKLVEEEYIQFRRRNVYSKMRRNGEMVSGGSYIGLQEGFIRKVFFHRCVKFVRVGDVHESQTVSLLFYPHKVIESSARTVGRVDLVPSLKKGKSWKINVLRTCFLNPHQLPPAITTFSIGKFSALKLRVLNPDTSC